MRDDSVTRRREFLGNAARGALGVLGGAALLSPQAGSPVSSPRPQRSQSASVQCERRGVLRISAPSGDAYVCHQVSNEGETGMMCPAIRDVTTGKCPEAQ